MENNQEFEQMLNSSLEDLTKQVTPQGQPEGSGAQQPEDPQQTPDTGTDKPDVQDTIETPPAGGDDPNKGGDDPNKGTEDTNKSNPMRELRNRYEEIKAQQQKERKLLERAAAKLGIPIEELETKLQEEEDKREAIAKNIPVETQRQLREYEQRLKALEEERIRENFNFRAMKLQQEYSLTQDQVLDFAQQARQAGFDIFKPEVDLNVLYRAFNLDNIIAATKEQTRQQVLAELKANKDTSPQTGQFRNQPGTQQSQNTLSDADFMSELFKSFVRR